MMITCTCFTMARVCLLTSPMAGRKVGKSTDANNNDDSLADDDVFFSPSLREAC